MSSLSATMCSLNPVPPPTYLNLSPTPVSYSFPCFVLGFDLSHKSCLGVCVCVYGGSSHGTRKISHLLPFHQPPQLVVEAGVQQCGIRNIF